MVIRFNPPPPARPRPRPRPRPPQCEAELTARARLLSGCTVAEMAGRAGVPVPSDTRRAKGFVGGLVERALGADAHSGALADFVALGIELKTIPLDRHGRPRETTFVCSIPMLEIAEVDWERSRVRRKLARVLWVPLEADPVLPLAGRRLGTPFLWSPSAEQEDTLRADWEELAGIIGSGRVQDLTGHLGQALQVRPKAANARCRAPAPDESGVPFDTLPRGFYLRRSFTRSIVVKAFESLSGHEG